MLKKGVLAGNWVVFSILALGIAEILTQLVVIREFLAVFYGNELVIGILLANWLLIGALGSWVGRRASFIVEKGRLLVIFHIIVAFILPVSIALVRGIYDFAFIRGELVGITPLFVSSFLILFPAAFITGFSLPLFSVMLSSRKKAGQVGRVYYLDSLSNIVGGALFSFLLVYFLSPFQVGLLVLVLNLAAAIVLSVRARLRVLAAAASVLLVIALVLFTVFDFEALTAAVQFPFQDVVTVEDSEYGRLVITNTSGQYNFFDNGAAIFSSGDVSSAEEKVHLVLQQAGNVSYVLVISGCYSGTLAEGWKYSPDVVDCVEMNPYLIAAGRAYTGNIDNRTGLYWMDPRVFVRQAGRRYDAVVVDAPDPGTALSNRLYTGEFFSDLRRVLADGGVVGISVPSGENYLSDEARLLDGSVYNAMRMSFRNVLVLPGERMFLVASDSRLLYSRYSNISVTTDYLQYHVQDRVDRQRVDYALSALQGVSSVNEDFRPAAYYYHLRYWLSQFRTGYLILVGLALAFFGFALWRVGRVQFAVLAAGFAGISLELVLIFSFQVVHGYVYQKIGVIVTMFMIGLAIGAWLVNGALDLLPKRFLSGLCVALAVYSLVIPPVVFLLSRSSSGVVLRLSSVLLFPLMTALVGLLVGALFPVAARRVFDEPGRTSGALYFFDYVGACAGAVIVSALLMPLVGMMYVCLITAAFCAVGAFVNRKK